MILVLSNPFLSFGTIILSQYPIINGRDPADYVVSKGSEDKTVIEFKLASNFNLEKNLRHQVSVYEKVVRQLVNFIG